MFATTGTAESMTGYLIELEYVYDKTIIVTKSPFKKQLK